MTAGAASGTGGVSAGRAVFNPFPGLRAFGPDEAHLFFGREEHLDELLGTLQKRRFLAVVGASGSGKSSLVLAGLLPALDGGLPGAGGSAWRVARMRPGADPIGRLAAALREPAVWDLDEPEAPEADRSADRSADGDWERELERDMTATTLRRSRLGLVQAVRESPLEAGENLLVLVDQFEELFRFRRLARRAPRREEPDEAGDRVEETAGADTGGEAEAFVHLLLEAAHQEELPIYVLLTMRSDFLGDCVQFPGLPEAINRGQYLIPRLDRRQRRAVIEGPVRVGGAEIDPPLLQRLLNDVGDDPDQLPILQHALMRTVDLWLERTGGGGEPIGLADYLAAGTMSDALARHAEEAWRELDRHGRRVGEVLFRCLMEKTGDGQGIRRPTTVAEIAAVAGVTEAEVIPVVEVLRAPGRAFLMPPSNVPLAAETLIDLSHESLMRVSQILKGWAAEEAEAVDFYRRVAQAAALHAAGKAGLWRDPELELALQWRASHRPNAAWAARYGLPFAPVMEFLDQSRADRDARRAAEEEAQRREVEQARALAEAEKRQAEVERRAAGRLRRAMVLVSVALIASLACAAWALLASHRAERLSEESTAAEVRALAASADHWVGAGKAFEALQEALIAADRYSVFARRAGAQPTLRKHVESALVHALFGIHEANRWKGHSAWPNALRWDPRTGAIVSAGYEQVVKRWRRDGTSLGTGARHGSTIFAVAVSPTDGTIASADGDGHIHLRAPGDADPGSGPDAAGSHAADPHTAGDVEIQGIYGGKAIRTLDFSPDGRFLVSGGDDGSIRIWTRRGQAAGVTRTDLAGRVNAVRFAPSLPDDGAAGPRYRIAVGGDDGSIEIWRSLGDAADAGAEAGAVPSGPRWIRERRFEAHGGGLQALDFHPDGRRLVSAGSDGRVVVWSLDGEEIAAYHSDGPVYTVRYSPDGTELAWAGADRVVHVRRPDGQWLDLTGHSEPIAGIDFSPDGTMLASTSRDMTVRTWRLVNPYESTLTGHQGTVWEVAVSPDGRRIASGSDDNTVRLWSAEGRELRTLEGHRKLVRSVCFSPSGKLLASASHDGTVRVWSMAPGGGCVADFHADAVGANEVDFSPDGGTLVTAGLSGNVRWWRPGAGGTYHMVGELDSGGDQVWGARFGPGGALLWTGAAPVAWLYEPRAGGALVPAGSDRPAGTRPMELPEPIELAGQGGGVVRSAFSPDGALAATAVVTGDALVWDTRDGHLVHRIHGHYRGVNGVAFSPDGALLATAGLDGLIKLWTTGDWSLRRTLQGHRSSVTDVAFGPRGDLLVSSSSDQTVKIWRRYDMPFDELVADAREWLADYQNLPRALRDELVDASVATAAGGPAGPTDGPHPTDPTDSTDPEETDR